MLAGVASASPAALSFDHQEALAAEGAKRHDNQGVLAE